MESNEEIFNEKEFSFAKDFEVVITGDGNCLFYSISHLLYGVRQNNHRLRRVVIGYQNANRHFLPELLGMSEKLLNIF